MCFLFSSYLLVTQTYTRYERLLENHFHTTVLKDLPPWIRRERDGANWPGPSTGKIPFPPSFTEFSFGQSPSPPRRHLCLFTHLKIVITFYYQSKRQLSTLFSANQDMKRSSGRLEERVHKLDALFVHRKPLTSRRSGTFMNIFRKFTDWQYLIRPKKVRERFLTTPFLGLEG